MCGHDLSLELIDVLSVEILIISIIMNYLLKRDWLSIIYYYLPK